MAQGVARGPFEGKPAKSDVLAVVAALTEGHDEPGIEVGCTWGWSAGDVMKVRGSSATEEAGRAHAARPE
jgi:hypothetical protein